jgi:glycosyltransferase involved in cell wall biosynthesis
VIGLRSGGVLETVQEGVTGTFYDDGDDPRALAAAVAGFDPAAVDPSACVRSARKFDIPHFQERLRAIVGEAVAHGGAARISDRPAGGLLPRRSPRRGAESMRIR